MKPFYLLLAALLSLMAASPAPAQEAQPYPSSAETFVIHSNILGEDRRVVIYNPDKVGGNVLPFYPVLYLLDENDMSMVTGMVKYLSAYNEQLPAMLVVGIDGGDQRMRDLTPTHSLYDNMGKLDPDPNGWLQPSGGGDKFLRFMREEVIPFVEKRYRTAPFRIFAGHSVGGLTAVHALTAHPDMFNAYLAVAPSLWWDKGGFVRSANQTFAYRRRQEVPVPGGLAGGRAVPRLCQELPRCPRRAQGAELSLDARILSQRNPREHRRQGIL